MAKVNRPQLNSPQGHALVKKLNAPIENEIAGLCLFCQKPITYAEQVMSGPNSQPNVDYALQAVLVRVPETKEVIVKPVRAILYHTLCVAESPYRAALLRSLTQIEIDFQEVNEAYVQHVKEKAVLEQMDKAKAEALAEVRKPKEVQGKENEKNA